MEVTAIAATAVLTLNAVVPPLSEVSALVPAEPVVWSQAVKVMEALPPF